MHFTLKNPSLKKNILDLPIHNRIRLPDSAIWKSIIYAKIVSRTPLIRKKIFNFALMKP